MHNGCIVMQYKTKKRRKPAGNIPYYMQNFLIKEDKGIVHLSIGDIIRKSMQPAGLYSTMKYKQ